MLAWQAEIQQIFVGEIQNHFDAEEREIFPVAVRFAELSRLIDELIAEHALLRDYFALATERTMDPGKLHDFAKKLSAHIRKEERELFESLQRLLTPEELASVGTALKHALNDDSEQASCSLPNPATRLRSRKEIDKR